MGSLTWRVFALLVAAPALLLAWLGLRAVRAERLEAEQHLREQQTSVTQLADASIANRLAEVARDLQRNRVPPVGTPLTLASSGLVTFPRDRVYFGPFAQHPTERITPATWSPIVSDLIEQAQTAEAQGKLDDATRALRALRHQEPRLRAWADLTDARINARLGRASARATLADQRWSESPGTTPSGLPVAVVASALSVEHSGEARRMFGPLIAHTLAAISKGQWWLSAEERRFYERELATLLAGTGGGRAVPVGDRATSRLTELEEIEQLARQSSPSRRDVPSYALERGVRSGYLMVWAPYDATTQVWRGLAVSQRGAAPLVDTVFTPLFAGLPFRAAIRDTSGQAISRPLDGTVWRTEALPTLRGWEIAFTGPSENGSLVRRERLWYGFVAVLLLVLFGGIGMTAQNVRQKTVLARMQSEFIAAVTHEFKSPITSIRLLVERIGAGRLTSPDSACAYAAAIGREVDRLERLVNRLLEAQQIDAGQQRHDFIEASLEQLTADAIRRIQPLAESRNMRIGLDVDGCVPPVVIDRAVIGDAVENLLDNAIKYSPAGSHIRVRLHADAARVCLDVEDQGIGIDADEIPRVFDKFYRARRGNLQNVRGTGLGLALVKAAAEAHGGSVDVASKPGKGSRFTIRLPLPAHPAKAS